MKLSGRFSGVSSIAAVAVALSVQPVAAQQRAETVPQSLSEADATGANEIVVTGLKRSTNTSVQAAPLAISAFGEAQLQESHIVSATDIQTQIPNVYFNKASTSPGQNQFAIRGMGVYGSQPGSTPTVGFYLDGVYQASTVGSVLPSFDIAGIEVLRGPQGLLFGQNVTAGALLIRTNQPSDTLKMDVRASIETGPEYRASAVITGPLTENINGKIAAFYDKDEGWFTNAAPLSGKLGGQETFISRAALKIGTNGPFSISPRVEYTTIRGQGAVSQNQILFGYNSFTTRLDHPGSFSLDSFQASADFNLDVGPGALFNQIAYRDYTVRASSDVDGTELPLYVLAQNVRYSQFSNELRYAGEIGPVDFTIGGYYFKDKLYTTHDTILALAPANNLGGSLQYSELIAGFASADIRVFDGFTINLGARYSWEHKDVSIKIAGPIAASPCSMATISCSSFDRFASNSWTAFTPKIGFQWRPSVDTNIYGFFTKGFRSGGYNLRVSSPTTNPGPYDQEIANTFEVGVKQYLFDRKVTANVSLFHTYFNSLQRDILIPDPVFGFVQTSTNVADAIIKGFEIELTYAPTKGITFGSNVGYLHDEFKNFTYDVVGNGGTTTISPANYSLHIPFLLPWTFSFYTNVEQNTDIGLFSGRAAFSFRDKGFSNDRNTGPLPRVQDLEASLSFSPKSMSSLRLSIYGRNLLNEVSWGYSNPAALPSYGGANPYTNFTATVLNKGRVLGAEISYKF